MPFGAVVTLLLLTCAPGRSQGPHPSATAGLGLHEVAGDLESPLWLTAPPGDPRLFIVEQPGRIRIVRDGKLLIRPFLDLTDRVRFGGERGLLSLAFHPKFAQNGFFFVDYTDLSGDTRIERYAVSRDPDLADPASARLVLHVDQPYSNHNGGLVMFGPDGMLFVGMGDGGSAGDPHRNGQNPGTLLGKLLRIDVDRGAPYAIPPDNPFVRRAGTRPEIWALGLRNPWRYCFDAEEGLLYVADVGQNRWEEIDAVPASVGGLNFGWNTMEGAHCFRYQRCDTSGLVLPVLEYGHGEGCSVTGGFVYRGRALPWLAGHYLYADYCEGWIRSLRVHSGVVVESRRWKTDHVGSILSFGQDALGELYILTSRGRVYRLVAAERR